MNQMSTPTKLQIQGYTGIKVTSMLNAIKQKEIYCHLRLIQQDQFRMIENKYNKLGYLNNSCFSYLWNLYWNFVLNDFRFEDKKKYWSTVTKIKKIENKHIGLKMLESMNQESKCKNCNKPEDKKYCSEECYSDND